MQVLEQILIPGDAGIVARRASRVRSLKVVGIAADGGTKSDRLVRRRPVTRIIGNVDRPQGDARLIEDVDLGRAAIGRDKEAALFQLGRRHALACSDGGGGGVEIGREHQLVDCAIEPVILEGHGSKRVGVGGYGVGCELRTGARDGQPGPGIVPRGDIVNVRRGESGGQGSGQSGGEIGCRRMAGITLELVLEGLNLPNALSA